MFGSSFYKQNGKRNCLSNVFGAYKPAREVVLMSFWDNMQQEKCG